MKKQRDAVHRAAGCYNNSTLVAPSSSFVPPSLSSSLITLSSFAPRCHLAAGARRGFPSPISTSSTSTLLHCRLLPSSLSS